jgi:hypothetical protein
VSEKPRAPDGRFVPRTGDAVLPPRQQQPRDEHGHFIPNAKVVSSKPYSRAVRELLDAPEGTNPPTWGEKLTEAQALAMVHISMARSGNVQIGMVIIDRAEGKVPQAAEDRDAVLKAGAGVRMLADLLGIDMNNIIDAEIVPQTTLTDLTPEAECPDSPSSPNESSSTDLGSLPDSSSTSSSLSSEQPCPGLSDTHKLEDSCPGMFPALPPEESGFSEKWGPTCGPGPRYCEDIACPIHRPPEEIK